MSKDAWEGNTRRSLSLNGWSYVEGNPIRNADPSGHYIVQYSGEVRMGQHPYGTSGICPHTKNPHDEAAWASTDYSNYLKCQPPSPSLASLLPVPQRANGYVEGVVTNISGFGCAWKVFGVETVYNFAGRERQVFTYSDAPWAKRGYSPVPGLSFTLFSISPAGYAGFISGFRGGGVERQYSKYFVGTSLGYNPSIKGETWPKEMGGVIGWGQFTSAGKHNNSWAAINGRGTISGDVLYFNAGIGLSKTAVGKRLKWPIDATFVGTWYQPAENREVDDYTGRELQMLRDIISGGLTPITNYFGPLGILRQMGAEIGASVFVKNNWITTDEYQEVVR